MDVYFKSCKFLHVTRLQFTNIVVLAQDALGTNVVDTDSCTVSCLLNLRQIQVSPMCCKNDVLNTYYQ